MSNLPATVSNVSSFLEVIQKAASDPSIDVDKMSKILDMQERILTKNAEAAFNVAMSDAQGDMGQIAADSNNPQTRSKYASYGKLDSVLRPIYTRHGFSLSFDTGEPLREDYIRILCHVSHKGGHSRTYKADMPADGKGAKGGDVMTKTHASGAAMSYGMRYLLKLIFNVAIGEHDTDGNAPKEKVQYVSEEQQANLQALVDEVGEAGKQALFDWLKITDLSDVPAKNYNQAVAGLEKRRKA